VTRATVIELASDVGYGVEEGTFRWNGCWPPTRRS
jgi:hypothetical protein